MGVPVLWVVLFMALAAPAALGAPQSATPVRPEPALDLVVVLDNSGSMRKSDPQFLMRAVVTGFGSADRLPKDTRLGVVVFAGSADLVLPLSPVSSAATGRQLAASLKRLDYTGKRTDIAAAVERASYELRQQGRPDAARAIVLLTDGIIDTGDRARDLERGRWLTTDLSDACARAGTRVFGVAFTEEADFQLIQSLGQRTGGDYYRILKNEDVPSAFDRIATSLAAPAAPAAVAPATPATAASPALPPAAETRPVETPPVPAPVAAPPAPVVQPLWLVLGPVLGMLGLVVAGAALFLFWRSRRPAVEEDPPLPEDERPYLVDLNDPPALAEPTYELTRRITRIGRLKGGAGVLHVDSGTVSSQHAEIRYRDGTYFLVDTASANKTRLDDGPPLSPYVETPLKGGRVISIANCRFEFVVPGADTEKTQVWVVDPTAELGVRPMAAGRPSSAGPVLPTVSVLGPSGDGGAACPHHPGSSATDRCEVCRRAYCAACMHERAGVRVCSDCRDQAAG